MGRHAAPSGNSGSSADAHNAFGAALRLLIGELGPFVDGQLTRSFPGKDWRAALAARDQAKTGHDRPVDLADPRRVLRILRDDYFAFSPRLTRTQTSYAHLIYDLTNTWAHSTNMDPYRARRGIEFMADLLLSLSREEAADAVVIHAAELDPVRGERPPESAQDADLDEEDVDEPQEDDSPDIDAEAAELPADPPGGDANDSADYIPAVADARRPTWLLDQLPQDSAAEVVRGEIDDIIAAEAPILLDRLLRLAGYRFGLQKVHTKRQELIEPYVPPHLIRRSANHDKVVWPEEEGPEGYTSYRIPAPDSRRPVSRIPYEELRNAMVEQIWSHPEGVSPDALVWLVNSEFGGQRVKSSTGDRLRRVIDAAVREGTLQIKDGAVVAAKGD